MLYNRSQGHFFIYLLRQDPLLLRLASFKVHYTLENSLELPILPSVSSGNTGYHTQLQSHSNLNEISAQAPTRDNLPVGAHKYASQDTACLGDKSSRFSLIPFLDDYERSKSLKGSAWEAITLRTAC